MKARTRMAPSPTGWPHIGNIRTALYDYALARQSHGQFILRFEDTDRNRFVEGAEEKNYEMYKAYGLIYDEGPDIGGPYAPYRQSEKLEKYQEAAHKLVKLGFAYYAFDSIERLEKLKTEQEKAGIRTHYDRKDRDMDQSEAQKRVNNGENYVIRLKIPFDQKISFIDGASKKTITWDTKNLDDIILLKSDGYPTYHLAVVVDDVDMKITHIIRGSEWIATTAYHIYLFQCFDYQIPIICHVTVIIDPRTNKKFSKRDATQMFIAEKFLKEGYLSEAVLNYLMLLGWAPKDNREFYTLDEFVKEFSLDGLQKANPVYNPKKLDWFAGYYIRKSSPKDLLKKLQSWILKYGLEYINIIEVIKSKNIEIPIKLIQERAITLKSIAEQLQVFFINPIEYDIESAKGINTLNKELIIKAGKSLKEKMLKLDENSSKWNHENWEKIVRDHANIYGLKDADMFMLLRIIISGKPISPPLFELMQYIGKNNVIERFEHFLKAAN